MATLLLVMKRPGNIRVVKQMLEPLGFTVIGITDNTGLADALAERQAPCLGLVDVSGFRAVVWQMCEALRANGVRFIVLSEPQEVRTSSQALQHGAVSIVQKPVAKAALLQLLRSLIS